MGLSFRAKLIAIVGTAALALVILIVAGAITASLSERRLADIHDRYVPKLELGPQLESQFERMRRGLQDAVGARDVDALAATKQIEAELLERLAGAGEVVRAPESAALRSAIEDYYGAAADVSRRLITGETGEPLVAAISAMQVKQARAVELLARVTAFDHGELGAAFALASRAQITGGQVRLGTSLACLFAVILLSWWLGRGVLRSLSEVTAGLARFGLGQFERPIRVITRDELGDLAERANQMAGSLRHLAEERDRTDWIKGAVAGIGQELRGELDPDEAAWRALRFLARYLDACAAALYYTDGGDVLRLLGAYAGAEAPLETSNDASTASPAAALGKGGVAGATPSFRLGEGLVGQAALREEITVVRDPPPGYLRVRSGLGEGAPAAIVLLPLVHGGRVLGVIELALFGPWTARASEALLAARETVVIAIEVARARMAMSTLLGETQRQAQRLREQEEELRARNDELRAQKDELRQINRDLEVQAEELERQRRALEKNNAALDEARRGLEQKAAELTTVSAYKSQFLTNMSHELRTPLNSMLILSNLLGDNESRTLTAKQVELARTIHTAGRDLLALINQVLDLAKIEAGKHEIRVGTVPLSRLVAHARRMFDPLARDKGLRFSVELGPDLPEAIATDGQRVEQILNNLVSNAVKFTERGEVALRIGRPAAGVRFARDDLAADRTVALAVSDTGLGIAPENQQRIFAAFEQVDGRIDRRYGGTGLGLSISRELAALLGGELQLQSELGRGSTFVCYLPFAHEETRAPAAATIARPRSVAPPAGPVADAASAPPPTLAIASALTPANEQQPADVDIAGRTILVVDDDMRTVYALSALLHGRGVEVLTADTGRAALGVLDERPDVDAVLMDIMMPEMDGYEATRRIRQDPRLRGLRIVALTAKAMAGDPQRCIQAGADEYLPKPVDSGRLLRTLNALLLGRARHQEVGHGA